jgi:uncharacterized protein (TIGR02246 family)
VTHHKAFLVAVAAVLVGLVAAHAEPNPEQSSEEQSIRKSAERYCEAFNDGDIDSLLSMWSDDADYVDLDGKAHRGKDEVGAMLKDSLENLRDYKLHLMVDSVRKIRPDVEIEDGTTTLTSPDGEKTTSRFTAVLVKSGDKWRIQSARELGSDQKTKSSESDKVLQPLEWLIGAWTSDDKGPAVNLTNKWALDKNFIVQDYTVAGKSGDDMHVVQWIGLDPLSGEIKSWAFDARGGVSEGFWTRDENSWVEESKGVLPDGRVGADKNTIRFVDDDHFEWRSSGRNIEGQPLPDADVKFIRKFRAEKADAP